MRGLAFSTLTRQALPVAAAQDGSLQRESRFILTGRLYGSDSGTCMAHGSFSFTLFHSTSRTQDASKHQQVFRYGQILVQGFRAYSIFRSLHRLSVVVSFQIQHFAWSLVVLGQFICTKPLERRAARRCVRSRWRPAGV